MDDPLPGECSRRFTCERLLASGGFGAVYLARQKGLDRPVAIKVLLSHSLEDPDQVARFLEEARITAQLNHPCIVSVIDAGADDRIPWIAFEYLPGPTLREIIDRAELTWREAVDAAGQMAEALERAHQAGVLHRDIKPENVLQAGAGRYKVADFGIAKWTGWSEVRTRTGVVMGTPAYISPEQISGTTVGPAADLYALGVVLFELLTGRLPFEGPTPLEILTKHLEEAPPSPDSFRPDLPPELCAIVQRALAKSPEDRFGSAAELRLALVDVSRRADRGRDERPGSKVEYGVAAGSRHGPAGRGPAATTTEASASPRRTGTTTLRRTGPQSGRLGGAATVASSLTQKTVAPSGRAPGAIRGGAIGACTVGLLICVWSFRSHEVPVAVTPRLPTSPAPAASAARPSAAPSAVPDPTSRVARFAIRVSEHVTAVKSRLHLLQESFLLGGKSFARKQVWESREPGDGTLRNRLLLLIEEAWELALAIELSHPPTGTKVDFLMAVTTLLGCDLLSGRAGTVGLLMTRIEKWASTDEDWLPRALLAGRARIEEARLDDSLDSIQAALKALGDPPDPSRDGDTAAAWLFMKALRANLMGEKSGKRARTEVMESLQKHVWRWPPAKRLPDRVVKMIASVGLSPSR